MSSVSFKSIINNKHSLQVYTNQTKLANLKTFKIIKTRLGNKHPYSAAKLELGIYAAKRNFNAPKF